MTKEIDEAPQEQDRKWIVWMSGVVVVIVVLVIVAIWIQHERMMNPAVSSFARTTNSDVTDHEKFAAEYKKLSADNVFVYRQEPEIVKVLEEGNGIAFFCTAADEWCQYYAPYLNEVAKAKGVEKIFYYDVANGRSMNSEEYRKIIEMLDGYTLFDDDGVKQIFIPNTFFVKDGKIIGNESDATEEARGTDASPEEFWTDERIDDL